MRKEFLLKNNEEAKILFGEYDENLRFLEKESGVTITARGCALSLTGKEKEVEKILSLLKEILPLVRRGDHINPEAFLRILEKEEKISFPPLNLIEISSKKPVVFPRSKGQRDYLEAMNKYDVVISIGPAGTGKTYLAVAMALSYLKKSAVERIILTRPAIEAGEKLGFLPGDLDEKIRPYLQPLHDAFYDILPLDETKRLFARKIIEVIPLAYMRGRTLNNSFIILDEGQNATAEQMKMFLTRLGFNSKVVVTGDVTQSDLPANPTIGLVEIESLLKEIKGIKFIYLTEKDVVRHPLVREIIKAYEKNIHLQFNQNKV
ncbi:MAG: hypothetical protein COZ37_00860 [bacterium (Candidatus Ratteibacteria) CG_4_10_14_3_um_filter_41_18]|uniref:PhoH-like protein n=3 Tax=Candidatus Ratteibacteria TaxID=2979319 RepID=A0A2M7E8F1_9BACT|nr:MAG: hypothetical protein AUJ76_03775 [Candidatus Omnitrophica bacterium CG1_02_41_171]PIV63985.1 MAG: hypothetical protein COS11_04670 [bacterium (Candidatus Ratteibacteria) CG01_land_8_20_14_3_00_40_19]PIW34260.1 MAG: hypothetical protein COW28_00190 [bacterium (Candidatus Ratteibacteria) CG15_BIG_FIL_POST_REV_8_21_14_020_41_12]PIW73822.1 MAG: hypothetical protein CO004_03885 [bacterium (Candidatus Ratteibacteria) CG_4_8_14_3_um_filter_41_36]PIX77777.1 MAG: hypothetical protein COZ37_00860